MRIGFSKSIAAVIAITTVAALLMGFVALREARADIQPAVSMWVEPPAVNFTTAEYQLGDKFNITVWANTYQDASNYATFVWQVTMSFNSTLFVATQAGFTGVGKSDFFSGHNVVAGQPIVTATNVQTGESLIGADSRTPGNGSLCWVELQIALEPSNDTSITSTFEINNTDTYLLDTDVNELTSTKYGAQYNYGLAPPDVTPPTIGTVSTTPSGNQIQQNTAVSVNATVSDNPGGSGVANATLSYSVDNATTWTNVTMTSSGTTWSGTIPGQVNGTKVWYFITASDNAGNSNNTPTGTAAFMYDVIPEFTVAILIAMMAVLAVAMIVYRKKIVRLP
jgi:hypothetical protein